jgi:hypothetical protein
MALVVSILKGDTSVAETARQHGLTVAEVEDGGRSFSWGPRMRSGLGPRRRRP